MLAVVKQWRLEVLVPFIERGGSFSVRMDSEPSVIECLTAPESPIKEQALEVPPFRTPLLKQAVKAPVGTLSSQFLNYIYLEGSHSFS